MSQETSEWLHNNILVGFTAKRGEAWWNRKGVDSKGRPNHFDGPVPIERVRELLDVPIVEATLTALWDGGMTTATDRKAIVHAGTGDILAVFKNGYRIHNYLEWLVENIMTLLDDSDLNIGSAGLLRKAGVAWCQVEMPDTVETPEGVAFRPFLSASTSCDGTLASTYIAGAQLIVCDNTLSAAHSEKGADKVKVRHTRNSLSRVNDVRQALRIVHKIEEDFAAEVAELCKMTVTDKQFDAFLVELLGEAPGPDASKNAVTIYDRKRAEMETAYRRDARSADWVGTAWGVVQAVNTHAHHVASVRGMSRQERNAEKAVTGERQAQDEAVKGMLRKVLATV